jgi:DNA replication initiation complex subunit (GINS family)
MDETLSYDYLWQALQKEKQTNQLLLLPRTFYEDVMGFINNKAKGSDLAARENAPKLIAEFFERRKQKILIYIAYNKPLPQPINSNELEFYNRVLQVVKSEKLENTVQIAATPSLRSLKDIPEIMLPSGNRIGPVKKDQVISLENEQDKVYLLENAICEQVY